MRILFLGDIVGPSGCKVVKKYSLGLVADLSVKSFSDALHSILKNDYYHSPDTSAFYRDHSPDIYLKTIINSI